MKSFVFHSFVGICFGAFVMVMACFGIIGWGGVEALDSDIFVKNGLANMFCGWFFSVSALIFMKEEWSLAKRTIIHFFTVTFLYFLLSFIVGWIPFTIPEFFIGVGLFLFVYLVIWVSFYLYFYITMKKLNESITER